MKDQIIKELNELAKLGVRCTAFVTEAIREGEFDDVIGEFMTDGVSVTEATNMILDIAPLRGIKV